MIHNIFVTLFKIFISISLLRETNSNLATMFNYFYWRAINFTDIYYTILRNKRIIRRWFFESISKFTLLYRLK